MPGTASSSSTPHATVPAATVSRWDLFAGFFKVGLLGFGGVAAWSRHMVVEERRWLSEKEYADLMGLGQVLPGPNAINTAVMIGDRFHGPLGSLIATCALMTMPLAIMLALVTVYNRFSADPDVVAAIAGAAAAAAGLVIGTAFKMTHRLRPPRTAILFGLLAFAAIGIFRVSLVTAVAVLAPVSILAAFLERRALEKRALEKRTLERQAPEGRSQEKGAQ